MKKIDFFSVLDYVNFVLCYLMILAIVVLNFVYAVPWLLSMTASDDFLVSGGAAYLLVFDFILIVLPCVYYLIASVVDLLPRHSIDRIKQFFTDHWFWLILCSFVGFIGSYLAYYVIFDFNFGDLPLVDYFFITLILVVLGALVFGFKYILRWYSSYER